MTRAISLHIGLNFLDPAAYGGWDGKLSGCINDANDMKDLASANGFSSTVLIDSQATSSRVIKEIGSAAQALVSGDIFFVSFSGHGGQVDDVNGDEQDNKDETWCLWDRQLIDDELYRLWSQFKQGVRIIVLSDSCHSGTVVRMVATLRSLMRDARRTAHNPSPSKLSAIRGLQEALSISNEEEVGTYLDSFSQRNFRRLPLDVESTVNRTFSDQNAAIQYVAGPSEAAKLSASLILISGCQDNQLSADGNKNGLFTQTLLKTWSNGGFIGNYVQFHEEIQAQMPDDQQPNYMFVGEPNPAFEAQKPFSI